MDERARERADARLDEAIETAGLLDPRDFLRARLRDLRERDPDAFRRALTHFEETLVPTSADPASDPLALWIEYGRLLGELTGTGRTVAVDPTGRAAAFEPGLPRDRMVLHLPDDESVPALPILVPREPSRPQRATYDLLVEGRLPR